MKAMKKLLPLIVAVAFSMVAFAGVAFAADGYTVTITKDTSDKAAHTYGAYQIFKGDLAEEDGVKTLSNVQWGDNASGATIITELNKLDGFSIATDATAADVAKAISDKAYTADSAQAKALAEAE